MLAGSILLIDLFSGQYSYSNPLPRKFFAVRRKRGEVYIRNIELKLGWLLEPFSGIQKNIWFKNFGKLQRKQQWWGYFIILLWLWSSFAEKYIGPYQVSVIEFFLKVNGF